MYSDSNVRLEAARRWISKRLVRVDEGPGGDAVLEQPSVAALYRDYCDTVPAELRWSLWRLSQELPMWCKRYMRKAAGGRFATVHCAGVRLHSGASGT